MIKGSIVALITPMNEEGSVDYAGLEKLIQFHLDEQTDGLLVLGTTGESSTLTQSEEEQILQLTVKKVAGRVPVIAGAGTNIPIPTAKKDVAAYVKNSSRALPPKELEEIELK